MTGALAGQTAIVTGGGSGIGRSIVERLTDEGAKVVSFDLTGDALDVVDVTDEQSVHAAVARLTDHGTIDILVNNVGVYPHTGLLETSLEEWRRVMQVNLDGLFLPTRAIVPAMIAAGYGRIVNISSESFLVGESRMSAYVASKGGVVGFTRSLARELGSSGITVNAVAPGLIASPNIAPKFLSEVVELQSVGRPGTPQDIAYAVACLCAPEAGFITGQTLNVDGGRHFH